MPLGQLVITKLIFIYGDDWPTKVVDTAPEEKGQSASEVDKSNLELFKKKETSWFLMFRKYFHS